MSNKRGIIDNIKFWGAGMLWMGFITLMIILGLLMLRAIIISIIPPTI